MATISTSNEFFLDEIRRRRKDAQDALAKLQAEQERIAQAMNEAVQELRALDVLMALYGGAEPRQKASQPLPTGEWEGVGLVEATNRVLRDAGRPLHVKEIVKALRQRAFLFKQKNPEATLTTNLVRGFQRGDYVRTAPNTYTLAGLSLEKMINPPGAVVPVTVFDERRTASE